MFANSRVYVRSVFLAFLLLPLFSVSELHGQLLYQVHTKWSDDFSEWLYYTNTGEGQLNVLYRVPPDFSSWQFMGDDLNGSIALKWRDDPFQWELRGQQTIFARVKWPGDIRAWNITSNEGSYELSMRYGNVPFEWVLHLGRQSKVHIFMEYEGDPRSWLIEYDTPLEVDPELVMMAAFLAIFHSMPK